MHTSVPPAPLKVVSFFRIQWLLRRRPRWSSCWWAVFEKPHPNVTPFLLARIPPWPLSVHRHWTGGSATSCPGLWRSGAVFGSWACTFSSFLPSRMPGREQASHAHRPYQPRSMAGLKSSARDDRPRALPASCCPSALPNALPACHYYRASARASPWPRHSRQAHCLARRHFSCLEERYLFRTNLNPPFHPAAPCAHGDFCARWYATC